MRRLVLAAALALLSAPAFAQDVKTDFDKDAETPAHMRHVAFRKPNFLPGNA